MTTAGGLGHTLPYLIPDFYVATVISICVVAAELAIISFIRHRFMETPFPAAFQVVVGGVLVFIAGHRDWQRITKACPGDGIASLWSLGPAGGR